MSTFMILPTLMEGVHFKCIGAFKISQAGNSIFSDFLAGKNLFLAEGDIPVGQEVMFWGGTWGRKYINLQVLDTKPNWSLF